MKKKQKTILAVVAVIVCLTAIAILRLTVSPVARIAREAYIYGYPLITFDMVRQQETNTELPTDERAPMGQVIKMRHYPPVESHAAAAPNADTLYTLIWLDVSDEPTVIGVPDMGDRYYMLPLLDGFSEVIEVIGASAAPAGAQYYLVTSQDWQGEVPVGMKQIKSPTSMIWVCGRIYCLGTPEDYTAVHALQDQIDVRPLSDYGKPYTPPRGTFDPDLDMKTSVRDQVNAMDMETYFTYLAQLLKRNPPHPQDAEQVKRFARIGLVPGQDFDPGQLSARDRRVINAESKLALVEMGLHLKQQPTTNGWLYFTEGVGNFGTDYLTRGMACLLGPGWNRPHDAIYPLSLEDADGDKYDGAKHRYVMHFEKGQLPPVDGFWSLTMYNKDLFFVPNSIHRYALSQRDKLIENSDGSIDLYLQAESPGQDKEANWLPAPKGEFKLVLRLYGPGKGSPSILDGSWTPPPVKPAES